MSMYAKVFEQIFDSSISEDYQTRHVFMDLLVLADPHGMVDMTVSAVARRTNVPVDIVERAIQNLMQPDPSSRTRDHEGRRLLPIDVQRGWGWVIANFVTYRSLRDENMRREQNRRAQANFKSKNKQGKPESAKVSQGKPESAHTEGEAELEVEEVKKNTSCPEFHLDSVPIVPETVCKIELIKRDGFYDVTQDQVEMWQADFPAVDVVKQIREMRSWSDANPKKRKTRDGFKSFAVKWLSKEQDKAGSVNTLRNTSTSASFANQKPASYFRGKEEVKLEF